MLDVTPHSFRHTFVTRCIQSGMDAATVKKIAGHSDEKMTNYYTHIEEEHIDDEYELYIQKYGAFYHHSFGGFSVVSVQPCPLFSDSGSKVGQRGT